LQFLILEKQNLLSTEQSDDDDDDDDDSDDEEGATDPGVTKTWEFIEKRWNLPKPKLIISVIYDIESFFMNQRLLKSIISELVKSATTAKGKRSSRFYIMLNRSL